jgi:hypothetical protein
MLGRLGLPNPLLTHLLGDLLVDALPLQEIQANARDRSLGMGIRHCTLTS